MTWRTMSLSHGFLVGYFQDLNHINLSFQRSDSNIAVFISKLEAFICKLDI